MSESSLKRAREVAVLYDLHCEAIDDPDPDWLAEEIAVALDTWAQEALAHWMIENSFATGHGDSLSDSLKELTWQVKELREQAAKAEKA